MDLLAALALVVVIATASKSASCAGKLCGKDFLGVDTVI